jgi:cell division protein FtsB
VRLAGGQSRPPLGLTPRGALLLVVMFALAAAAVYPLRQYVSQADRIQRLQEKQRALEAENQRLDREHARLKDPAYVKQLAKRDFHLVEPGEEAWVVTGTPPTTRPTAAPAPRAEPEPPWYRRAWSWLTARLR